MCDISRDVYRDGLYKIIENEEQIAALTPTNSEIFFLKPARPNKAEEVYSSRSLDHIPSVLENILFLHAFTGCNTVSATFFQGKIKFFKTFQNNPDLAQEARHFKEVCQSLEKIIEHGSQLLLAMYDASVNFRKPNIPDEFRPSNIQLAETYRYRMYLMAISKNKKVSIGKILPTVDAFTQHLKRVYLQVQTWLYGESVLNVTDWGWELKNNSYYPVKMTQPPGPPSVMSLIFCSCKKDCGSSCGCRKNGLVCNLACKNCAGSNCTNMEIYEKNLSDIEEDEEENLNK